ncbi:hypothetical protein TGME49_209170 [Toxoplasma gondii ME49]|uniref:Transmembrane protein n=4 Tax=Toxoplasma gondii TaxID=5811 RepID=B6KPA4_TOXGV|nr:hypothetical protein TGME49_209170 [Toxoplasma gondii ME49]ESS29450.1 hypothetical protein TGVEG_209170 [Toxoplasma gondii VEG]KFG34881.1 hypothetical protein TGDOM2_209170 [Toxoplasma gondii GAB2-2007-GAL-DOM2]PIL98626.1 hypothetical protein TGCOUG_209170 [Toxoplasma gondii COUG]EPT32337.1 hypothetical protein TGME49_209170 [Toxoplasma gondii ME49]CEL71730.1 TPA: hypothetical protein BN1205_039300 [Toxoplasma gondii VEG]|eukprot:XP_002369677.1 hypothetical protein TGME49_209170 [Toxoplasma gondii ME49]
MAGSSSQPLDAHVYVPRSGFFSRVLVRSLLTLVTLLVCLTPSPSDAAGNAAPQEAEYMSRSELAAGTGLRIPPSTNPQFGQRCEAFRGPDPFWSSPPVGSHQYWQLSVSPPRTNPPLADLRSYSTVGMYEATPQVSLFPPAEGLSGTERVRAPVLQPAPWLQLRADSTKVPIKQISKFPQVEQAAETIIMWCLREAVNRSGGEGSDPARLAAAVQILRESVDLRELLRQNSQEALPAFSALFATVAKELPGLDVRMFRFWVLAANSKGHENEPEDMYVASMEQARWTLANALVRTALHLEEETVDEKLVDCDHLTFTAYSAKLQKVFPSKETKVRFCSISVSGWILYAAHRFLEAAKAATESGDSQAAAAVLSIQESVRKCQGTQNDVKTLWPVFEQYRSAALSGPPAETTATQES